ncbi:MAG: sigma-70 family RNA polymerase sigma factor [Polyangiaceae bacterium]|nr:sigma-70 family RNA polymerase sigma factor [Polyangiaceae bacterium]
MNLTTLIVRARAGDLAAYGQLVEGTKRMVYAVARRITRNHDDALDALQETYLRGLLRLGDLQDPDAFGGWLRRIAVSVASNCARSRRFSFVEIPDLPGVPVLDELECTWSTEQRRALARALMELEPADRSVCDRFYHGGWSAARLAQHEGSTEATMRKRLQRIRDRLRKDIEMIEQRSIRDEDVPDGLADKIVGLLALPRLTDLPENPVGRLWQIVQSRLDGFEGLDLADLVDERSTSDALGSIGLAALLSPEATGCFRTGDRRVLRTTLTVPMLLAARGRNAERTLRLMAAGKVYRPLPAEGSAVPRLEAFHQAELLVVGPGVTEWDMMPILDHLLEGLFPGARCRLEQGTFGLCEREWALSVDRDGSWVQVGGWGKFRPEIVSHLGCHPEKHAAIGAAVGLERLACLYFGIDDVRKVDTTRLEPATNRGLSRS